jgi:hypothetical protein
VPERRRGIRARAVACLVAAALLLGAAGGGTNEDLFRQVKIDVFDQNWAAVLRGCEAILARDPTGPLAPQASFYRARALSRLPGREAEGLQAFRTFVTAHPDDKVLMEDAWSSLFEIACGAPQPAGSACAGILREGLAHPSSYVSTLAAIHASDSADESLKRKALARLKAAYATQTDSEIRNEILIAILKIDPRQVPATAGSGSGSAPAAGVRGATKAPSMIRLSVFNKTEGRYEVRVNLPIAFARMLIDAVGEEQKRELRRGAKAQGIDLDDIFTAIEKSGAGKLLEVDDADSRIEIWIE